MRRMIPQKLINAIKALINAFSSLIGKIVYSGGKVKVNGDFEADGGITSKGIANTGALANIGNVAVSGNIEATGTIDGQLKDGLTITPIEGLITQYSLSKRIGNVNFIQFKFQNQTGETIAQYATIGQCSYHPTSDIVIVGFKQTAGCTFTIHPDGSIETSQIINSNNIVGFVAIVGIESPES